MENIIIENESLYLRKPTLQDKEIIWEFRNEFIEYGSLTAGDSGLLAHETFEEWFEKTDRNSKMETLPKDRVLCTQFLTMRKSDNKLVGMINLRHELNDYLSKFGGHIGDCIRPTERHKGYATAQKLLCLEYCKKLGISPILITAKVENIYSQKSIMKSGGVFEKQITDESNGNIFNRYWITL